MQTVDFSLVTKKSAESAVRTTMQAAVYKGDSVVEVESVPVPEIGMGEVLIRVESCGICHTAVLSSITFPAKNVFTARGRCTRSVRCTKK